MVGGLVGGVVVGGAVVGGVVVGGAFVGGDVAGGEVAGGDLVEGAVVGGDDVPLPGVFVAAGDVVAVAEPPSPAPALPALPALPLPPPPVVVDVGAGTDADDFPLERTANQSFSTPCPAASPFLASLT